MRERKKERDGERNLVTSLFIEGTMIIFLKNSDLIRMKRDRKREKKEDDVHI